MPLVDAVNGPFVATPGVLQLGLPDPNLVPYNLVPGSPAISFNRTWLVTFTSIFIGVIGYNSLRTTFEIEKTCFSTANKAKITLYNLSDLSRADYLKGGTISLAVGYGGVAAPVIPILTLANVYRVHHERKGPDIISIFEVNEGGRALSDSIFNVSFPAGTPVTTIVNAIIASMGLLIGPQIGLLPEPYNHGTTFSGPCKTILDRILIKELGLRWWTVGNAVFIAPSGIPAVPTAALVSEQTGLLGTPNLGAGQGGDNTLSFTTLINPLIAPGGVVQIVSKFLTIAALVKKINYDGDTHGSKWTMLCECSPIDPTTAAQISPRI